MSLSTEVQKIRDSVFEMLSAEGFRPELTNEGDITVKYEGMKLWIEWFGSDDDYFRVLLPNFWSIDSAEELTRAYIAASRASHKIKGGKLCVVNEDNLWASVETVISEEDIVNPKLMLRRFSMISHAVNAFREAMSDLENPPNPDGFEEIERAIDEIVNGSGGQTQSGKSIN